MDEQFLIHIDDLDAQLYLGRSSNRAKLVKHWKELSKEEGKNFEILCSYLTAYEYQILFKTDKVTVVPLEAKKNKKRLLEYMEQVIVAQVEQEHLNELRKYQGFLSRFSLEVKLKRACEYVLKLRKLR